MPKNVDYLTKLSKENWKEIRTRLASQNHVDEARHYLASLSDHIRIFITDGLGFGDQMFIINTVQQLEALGYKGVVEIIAHQDEVKIFASPTYKPALRNILKLYGIEHLFERDFLFYVTPENITIHFYDYAYFKANRDRFAEVEVALFPGILGLFYDNYCTDCSMIPYLVHGVSNISNRLTFIAKSKKALYLNAFTADFSGHVRQMGFVLQLKRQRPRIHYLSFALSYCKTLQSFSIVQRELLKLKQKQPLLGNTLEHIIELQAQKKTHTFAIYAIHHLPDPQYVLNNLLLGSRKAHAGTPQPLLILILSPIFNDTWRQLTTFSQNATVFLDISNEELPPVRYDSGFIYVLRLPSIPSIPFDYIFTHSTYPPVYEGVNAALSLKSAAKRGLPCPRLVTVDDGINIGTRQIVVSGHFELPTELVLAGNHIICPMYEPSSEEIEPLSDRIALLMCKYAGLSLPVGLPAKFPPLKGGHPRLNFNFIDKILPPKTGDNRLAYAIAVASQAKDCTTKFDPDYCSTQSAIVLCQSEFDAEYCHTEYNSSIYASHGMNAVLRGFSYGLLEGSMTYGFKAICQLPEDKAYRLARSCEFIVKGYLEGNINFSLFLLATESGLDFVSMSSKNKRWIQHATTALLFLSLWLPQLFEFDPQEQFFSFFLTVLSMFTHMAGQQTSRMLCSNITNVRFFARRNAQKPSATVTLDSVTPALGVGRKKRPTQESAVHGSSTNSVSR